MEHNVTASFNNSAISSRKRKYTTDIRTYKLDFGVQYEQPINRKNTLVVGATYGLGHNINRNANYYDQRITTSQGTIGDTTSVANAFEMPHSFGVGAVWNHRDRLRVGFDYNLQLWDGCKSPMLVNNQYVTTTNSFKNRHQFTIGGEYVKRDNSVRLRDRIRYRFGLSYATPYTKINGVDGPCSYTASVGVGIPITNYWSQRSVLNIAAQYERIEPKMSTMITENYFRLCIGITFNEGWFAKWKVK
jgi:hypothetical protein